MNFKYSFFLIYFLLISFSLGDKIELELRDRVKESDGFIVRVRDQDWDAKNTAVLICDMWDSHHCYNAVKRAEQLAPRINRLVNVMRNKGAVIIHAPSSCMNFYKDTPARKRAINLPDSVSLPEGITNWLHWINEEEEKAGYPIDHSDGGEDDDPDDHAKWERKLIDQGRNPNSPWMRQIESIDIDQSIDYITDSGVENWNILDSHKIQNVLLVGVHTNMCVLGRPFGLRQLAKNGKNVVLVRDLTDTMYNPKMEPKVSHFTGTDFVVNHIEKYVCPTVKSSQIIDGSSFKFKNDKRPKILFLIGEREYLTSKTLPKYADANLLKKYRVEYLFAADGQSDFGDIQSEISDADLLFLSVRRRALSDKDMLSIRDFIIKGKPVVGIRTSNHAFSLRGKSPAIGYNVWEEFDQQVFGGNYTNHYGNKILAIAEVNPIEHPVLEGLQRKQFDTGGSLYKVLPLKKSTTVLLNGKAPEINVNQPLAWTNKNDFGGHSFYTSLGHIKDFENKEFVKMLNNAVDWLINGSPKLEHLDKKKRIHEEVDGALSPENSRSLIKVRDDLEIDLVLSEPIIKQPLHMSFDHKGRLWVVQYSQYPDPAGLKRLSRDKVWRVSYDRMPPPPPHGPDSIYRGADKISIHEDTNGDGIYNKHKIFADGLNMATSVAHDGRGVWVTNPPYLLYYKDEDGDDIPDSKPTVHLQGFGLEDSHSIANSLVLGLDGWVYGAQGSTISASIVTKLSSEKVNPINSMGQNIWRYNPQKIVYELFAEGGGNAFGLEIDSRARVYSGHNGGNTRGFHYIKGAYYQKSWGKHGSLTNEFAYGFFPAMANAQVERFTHQFIIYEDHVLPERFHGKLLGVDVLHNNVVMSEIIPSGSTFKTKDIERFIKSDDPWFRPVMITDAPDGSVYIADWYDKQVNHYRNHEGQMDKKLGRIYRVRNKDFDFNKKIDFTKLDQSELLDQLNSNSRLNRRTAFHQLKLRFGFDDLTVDWKGNPKNATQVNYLINSGLKINLKQINDPGVKGYAIRLLSENSGSNEYFDQFNKISLNENNKEVISQLISSLQQIEFINRTKLITNLLLRDDLRLDPCIPLQLWWALEAMVSNDDSFLREIFSRRNIWVSRLVHEEILERLMRRFAAEETVEGYDMCDFLLKNAPTDDAKVKLINGFLKGGKLAHYSSLSKGLIITLENNKKLLPLELRLRVSQEEAIDESILYIKNKKTSIDDVAKVLLALSLIKSDKVYDFLFNYIDIPKDEKIEIALMSSLNAFAYKEEVHRKLFKKLTTANQSVKESILELLLSDSNSANYLISKIDSGDFSLPLNNFTLIEKLKAHNSSKIKNFLESQKISTVKGVPSLLENEIKRVKTIIKNGGGNPKEGEAIFKTRCAGCHKMFNEGGQIGPDLTSYQKNDQDTLLISIIAPGAEIREGYENVIIKNKDGLVFSGFLLEETKSHTTLRELSGTSKFFRNSEINSKTSTGVSLMPNGLLNGLNEVQLKNLFAYLRSTTPPF